MSPPLTSIKGFEDHLEEFLAPLRDREDLSVCAVTESGHRWVLRSPGCELEEDQRPGRYDCRRLEQRFDAIGGTREIWLCGGGDRGLDGLIGALGESALQLELLEDSREGLCEELGVSYETLNSIYTIGSDPGLLLDPSRALARILEHLTAFDRRWRAGFWQVEGAELVPLQSCERSQPESHRLDAGILGRCISERQGIIADQRDLDSQCGELEPEFTGARSLAVTPMFGREEPIGCLAVWSGRARSFDSATMGLLTAFAFQGAMILNHERLYRERLEDAQLRREMQVGAEIQRTLLRARIPRECPHLDVGVLSLPSRQIDGDFFEFLDYGGGLLDVLIADAMGKGLSAAMLGAAVKNEFFRATSATPGGGRDGDRPSLELVLDRVNRGISSQLRSLGSFVTACLARFDFRDRTLRWVDCGHTNTLHWQARSGRVVVLEHDPEGRVNLPLGVDPDSRFEAARVGFSPGDAFVFYSDGVTEAMNPAREMFGIERLIGLIVAHHELSAPRLAARVESAVADFSGGRQQSDDLSCLVLKLRSEDLQPPGEPPFLEIPAEAGHLVEVRDFVARVVRGLPELEEREDVLNRIQVAVVEATTNVIRHGYGGEREGFVRIERELSSDELRFVVLDQGSTFDPQGAPPPAFDGTRESGFGVFLQREIMQEIRYQPGRGSTNQLTLIWNRGQGDESR